MRLIKLHQTEKNGTTTLYINADAVGFVCKVNDYKIACSEFIHPTVVHTNGEMVEVDEGVEEVVGMIFGNPMSEEYRAILKKNLELRNELLELVTKENKKEGD